MIAKQVRPVCGLGVLAAWVTVLVLLQSHCTTSAVLKSFENAFDIRLTQRCTSKACTKQSISSQSEGISRFLQIPMLSSEGQRIPPRLRLRGGGEESFDKSTQASIFRGQMPQDISSEGDDEDIIDALAQGDFDTNKPNQTPELLCVKGVIRNAAVARGELPNERYTNLTAEEERQLELDELLWFLATEGDTDMIPQVIAQGANISSVDAECYNQTALHCACQLQGGCAETVRLLASLGAKVDAKNANDNTPLHEAAYWAHKEAVLALLELGADPFALNAAQNTPLLQAEGNWRAASRPAPVQDFINASLCSWDDVEGAGWHQRLKVPQQRKEVVDILKHAMGNRSYGRGADTYCGGVFFPDMYEDWDEETEHYNPMRRKRGGVDSIPPPRNFLAGEAPKPKFNFKWDAMQDLDAWMKNRWEGAKDKAMELGLYSGSTSDEESESHHSGHVEDDSEGDTRFEGKVTTFDDDAGAPEVADDGAEGYVESKESKESD